MGEGVRLEALDVRGDPGEPVAAEYECESAGVGTAEWGSGDSGESDHGDPPGDSASSAAAPERAVGTVGYGYGVAESDCERDATGAYGECSAEYAGYDVGGDAAEWTGDPEFSAAYAAADGVEAATEFDGEFWSGVVLIGALQLGFLEFGGRELRRFQFGSDELSGSELGHDDGHEHVPESDPASALRDGSDVAR